jgi:hypothetical protein
MTAALPFASAITDLIMSRQHVKPMDSKKAARAIHDIHQDILSTGRKLQKAEIRVDRTSSYRAANTLSELRGHLAEWYGFYNGYDPMFTWWVSEPYARLDKDIETYTAAVREKLVGIKPGDDDAIVGQPIGRDGLLVELEAEKISYTPEELLWIGEQEYAWVVSYYHP